MFKKVLFPIFIVLLTINTAVADNFNTCNTYYKDQKYNTAANCFYNLLKYDTDNVQAHFYYAASLFFDRQYELSYQEYNYIAQKYPNSQIGKYSKNEAEKVYRKIQYLKTSKKMDTGNYLKDLDQKTKWYFMPIKIFVQQSKYRQTALKAFQEWQYKSNGKVKFTIVKTEKEAQIKVYFVDKITNPISHNNLGITNLKYIINMNTSAEIEILQRTDSNQMRSHKQIYPVVLHEIGHALGISGHSKSNNDIMYENDYTNDIHLSNRDIYTLKEIYK